MHRRESRTQFSRSLTCFVLLVICLTWSVFAFGSADRQYRETAILLTAISGVLGYLILPKQHWIPRFGPIAWASLGFLLCFGYFMAANAKADHSILTWSFTTFTDRLLPAGPGSVTQSSSFRALLELSAVIVAVIAVGITTQTKAWKSVVYFIAVMGAMIAAIGIFHKAIAAKSVWLIDEWHAGSFFAPYIYNANAAAFMNLSCALSLGLFLGQAEGTKGRVYRCLWLTNALLCGIGVMAAGSKGATLILILMLLATLLLNKKRFLGLIRNAGKPKNLVIEKRVMIAGIIALVLGFGLVSSQNLVSRTRVLYSEVTEDGYSESFGGRTAIIGLMRDMIRPSEGGWPGFGPGSFRHLVPYFAIKPEFKVKGRWQHGHCDPLQTIVEWGYFGAAAWFTFGIGAVIAGIRALSRKSTSSNDRPVIRGIMIALAATGLHSCFDFPFSIYSIHLCAMLLCGILWGLSRKMSSTTMRTFHSQQ
jgi:hypothetical protein